MKKISAILLALVMMLSMVAMADTDPTGTIVVKNIDANQDYVLYRILDLEWNEQTHAYRYILNTKWAGFFTGDGAGAAYVTLNTTEVEGVTYVTANTLSASNAQAFAQAALKYAEDNSIAADYTETNATVSGTDMTFAGVQLGYYLVDTTLGSLCALDTTAWDSTTNSAYVEVQEKNAAATVDSKQVQEDSDSTWGTENDADMTQGVNYQVTITAQAGAENYVLHDVMADGLTFGAVTGITVKGTDDEAATTVAASDYTVKTTGVCEEGCDFEVVFTDAFCATLEDGDVIVVSYNATLNTGATVGSEGNENAAWLTYGDGNETTPQTTTTYTWQIPVFKHNASNTGLAEAQFTLSKNADGSEPYTFIETTTENTYRIANSDETGSTTIITDNTGAFVLQGLDSDTYYLTETVAPDGYNKLSAPVVVVIADDGTVSVGGTNVTTVDVLNQTGSELPSTGGIGTTIFYTVGGLMMAAAVVLLVAKKKVAASK